MENLTPKQKKILDFIIEYNSSNGISPTIEEIRKKFKLKAVSTIHEHTNTLIEKGYLTKSDHATRGLIPKKQMKPMIEIPIIGKISAGKPIEAIEGIPESVSIMNEKNLNPKDCYALTVEGNSMIDDGIYDGDTVIIKKQSVAENGQTVVAIIDNDGATLKRLFKEENRYRLEPRNKNMLPLYSNEVEVRGVVIQIIGNIKTPSLEKKKLKRNHEFRTIDLFAGIGGIRIGFENAGFKTVFANDFDKQCKETYDRNFSDAKLIVEDIKKIGIDDLPTFDFVLGGFPCQSFSIAGHRQGFNDTKGRGELFFDIVKIIRERKPEGFLLENVKNLKSHDKGGTFTIIQKELEQLGYHIHAKVLNSMDYGNIPQNRERIYIVGFKNSNYYNNFTFPDKVPLTFSVKDILEKNVPEKYYYTNKPLHDRIKDHVTDSNKVYQWRRQYVRENKKGVCPTLTANMGMGGHNVPIIVDNKGIRKLTPLECARIQGFPSIFTLPALADSALYKQIGNSVSVPVIHSIAKQMMKAMSESS